MVMMFSKKAILSMKYPDSRIILLRKTKTTTITTTTTTGTDNIILVHEYIHVCKHVKKIICTILQNKNILSSWFLWKSQELGLANQCRLNCYWVFVCWSCAVLDIVVSIFIVVSVLVLYCTTTCTCSFACQTPPTTEREGLVKCL